MFYLNFRLEQLVDRLTREASLASHHEFEVDEEMEPNDRSAADRLSSSDFEQVSEHNSIPEIVDCRVQVAIRMRGWGWGAVK